MIQRGWHHAALERMTEAEFLYWLDQQLEYDRAVEEARAKAAEEAGHP